MSPWTEGKDNGGATERGVTEDSVKVVIYIENQQQAAGGVALQAPVDQATKQTGTVPNAIRDTLQAFDHAQQTLRTYQTWGRTIDFQVFEATGADEAAQTAGRDGHRRHEAVHGLRPDEVGDRWRTGAGGRASRRRRSSR